LNKFSINSSCSNSKRQKHSSEYQCTARWCSCWSVDLAVGTRRVDSLVDSHRLEARLQLSLAGLSEAKIAVELPAVTSSCSVATLHKALMLTSLKLIFTASLYRLAFLCASLIERKLNYDSGGI